jgi:uncharacterized membrane protein YjgN (DUF898 family)
MVGDPLYAQPVQRVGGETAPVAGRVRRVDFQFTGDAGEFFRIWIVNLLLSVVTLGIYSAWAKVRTKQYFYRNTLLDGVSFDYVADPIRILKGRLLFMAAGGVLVGAQYYSAIAYGITLGFFLLCTPWVVVKALSFNARNSSFRNLRFGFQGTVGEAYGVYLLCGLVQVITLGTGTPYFSFRQHKFMAERHTYGAERFVFHRRAGEYFRLYLRTLLITLPIIAVIVGLMVLMISGMGKAGAALAPFLMILLYGAMLVPGAYLRAGLANLLFDGLEVGPHTLRCDQKMGELLRLYVENLLALLFSLGLAFPWARIRMARYKAKCMKLAIAGSLDVMALPGKEAGAFGEAAHDLGDFDFDVG